MNQGKGTILDDECRYRMPAKIQDPAYHVECPIKGSDPMPIVNPYSYGRTAVSVVKRSVIDGLDAKQCAAVPVQKSSIVMTKNGFMFETVTNDPGKSAIIQQWEQTLKRM